MPSSRLLALGDIHGCATALASLLDALDPGESDTIVALGDYIDRGPRSREVLDQLLSLRERCRLILLLGNHEEMLLSVLDGAAPYPWLQCGGAATLESYGFNGDLRVIPEEHVALLRSCVLFFEARDHFFVHANYLPNAALADQPLDVLLWRSLRDSIPGPHCSGKIAVVGHTPGRQGEIVCREHLWRLDTYCYGGGWLTAIDVASHEFWQGNERGEVRTSRLRPLPRKT